MLLIGTITANATTVYTLAAQSAQDLHLNRTGDKWAPAPGQLDYAAQC
jgi:hypothetical protein